MRERDAETVPRLLHDAVLAVPKGLRPRIDFWTKVLRHLRTQVRMNPSARATITQVATDWFPDGEFPRNINENLAEINRQHCKPLRQN